jgi:hypothetical protein
MVNKQHINQNEEKNEYIVKRMLARIPPEILSTFTDEQLAELKKVFIERANQSAAVNIRVSLPFFQRRFYFVCLAGKERRSRQRLHKSKFKVINPLIGTSYILLMISLVLGSLYLLKGNLKIDSLQYQQLETSQEYLQNTFSSIGVQ